MNSISQLAIFGKRLGLCNLAASRDSSRVALVVNIRSRDLRLHFDGVQPQCVHMCGGTLVGKHVLCSPTQLASCCHQTTGWYVGQWAGAPRHIRVSGRFGVQLSPPLTEHTRRIDSVSKTISSLKPYRCFVFTYTPLWGTLYVNTKHHSFDLTWLAVVCVSCSADCQRPTFKPYRCFVFTYTGVRKHETS